MSAEDRIRWNRHHAENRAAGKAAGFLRRVVQGGSWSIAPGRVLDVACGKGRNALYLAQRGFDVTAIDISPVALAAGRSHARRRSLSVDWQNADLENFRLPAAEYDLIVNINYLQRSLFAQLALALKAGGHILFETYLIDQQAFGFPQNPDYLLDHNELLERFRNFRILSYHEGKFDSDGESAFRAGVFAQKTHKH